MDSSSTNEVAHDFPPYFKVYKDGRIERYTAVVTVDACHDPSTGVQSKDVMISSETVSKANIIAISIEYRLAPEHPLPIAYEDSWAGLEWVATHSNGLGSDLWLNDHADFGRVFLGGESAGANIAHFVAVRAGSTIMGLAGLKIEGLVMVHPFF
ncbi:hypothetical protein EZV62_011355 [Acer yangbiense]|uniref:Alpha/beta hydrolase fold-3 domain-containing protein n=1 Tax=Acer yangbiense TaxID=1000413 RepID=A0A5C7I560_9ROSI|nr:hypothetical protein EZV62_011355 [Acer yangbiense]